MQKAIDRGQVDVIGIDTVIGLPAERLHGVIRLLAQAVRLGADNLVLAVGLVPDGRNIDPCVPGVHDCLQLGDSLVKKAITHAKAVFFEFH